MLNGGASKVVVVDKETNTEATARSRHRHHAVQEQAARNSAIRRSQTFSPSGKVVPQICKVCAGSHPPVLKSTWYGRSNTFFSEQLGPLTLRLSVNAATTLAILFSLKTMELLQNGIATHFRVTTLFSMTQYTSIITLLMLTFCINGSYARFLLDLGKPWKITLSLENLKKNPECCGCKS